MSQRYCRHCGAELEPGDRYCSDCGEETELGATYPTQRARERDEREGDEWESGDEWSTADTGPSDAGDGWDGHGGRHPSGSAGGDTTFAAITHVLALFTWVLGPLIVYLVTDDPFVKENAANATNWQIMFTLYMIISFVLLFVLIGFLFILLLPLLDLAFVIIAAIKASEGEAWSYPLTPKIL